VQTNHGNESSLQFISLMAVEGIASTTYGLIPFQALLRPDHDSTWFVHSPQMDVLFPRKKDRVANAMEPSITEEVKTFLRPRIIKAFDSGPVKAVLCKIKKIAGVQVKKLKQHKYVLAAITVAANPSRHYSLAIEPCAPFQQQTDPRWNMRFVIQDDTKFLAVHSLCRSKNPQKLAQQFDYIVKKMCRTGARAINKKQQPRRIH
jgi:hypothetical protein